MTENNNTYPNYFYKGTSPGDGSCFFDSFGQGLEKQKGIKVTVEQLRKDCQEFAQMNPPKWFAPAIFNKPNQHGQPLCHDVDSYIASILNNNEWGDPEVEGRVLCQKYKVKLHLIEEQSCYMHLLVEAQKEINGELPSGTNNLSEVVLSAINHSYTGNQSDSKEELVERLNEIISQGYDPEISQEASELLNRMEDFGETTIHNLISFSGSLSLDNLDYNDQNTIHIINDGMSHFEPLLDKNRDLIEQLQKEQIQEQNDHLVARRIQEKDDCLLAKELQVDEILEHCGRKKDDPIREEVQNILDGLLVKNPNKGIVDVIRQCIDLVKQHILKPKSVMKEPSSTSKIPSQLL
ncbi:OTU domain-containing protein [Wolbachia endosymbiont of Folsomia candida]|uniref:hypothetical protein n=1 Tax=Wolbachia endosymbiont of Folsomia candida TaxID=169402 RepID=UPI000A97FDCE|nr:hypothetical protein [Wolbachia endosymbiont of Folsomia candida]APR98796.1 hypothetical protein ASM33_06230 [Wolbachia endosymbiont of Folsomia candida]